MMISRRDLLKLSAGAAAGALTGAAQSATELTTRPIPSSGERLPVVGIGTNRYRAGPESEIAPLRETLKTFAAAGGKVIDTAPIYSSSEVVLGELVAGLGIRNQLFIATKVYASGRAAGIDDMDASFKRLRTGRIDLIQVHSLSDTVTQLATMREGKAKGRYRYVGVTTSRDSQYPEMEAVLQKEKLDFVQVDSSIENRMAAGRILPLALERGVATLINLPFGRASLFSGARQIAPAVGRRIRLPELGAVLPQVRHRPPGRDLCHPRDAPAGARRRQPWSRPRAAARPGNAQKNGAVLRRAVIRLD